MPDVPAHGSERHRRNDLDWLRIAAVFMLIPYHASRIFDLWEPFYVKNAETSAALTGIRAMLDPWGMPLLFVLSGAATWLALRHRTGSQYLRERVLRLILPLVFGLVVIVPPQAYLAWLGQGSRGTYWQFFRHYWTMQTGEVFGWLGGFTLGQLWFILYLFVFSLLGLPLFVFLKREPGGRAVRWLARLSERPGTLFLFILPFWLTEPLPGPVAAGLNPFSYLLLFIAGFVLIADERFQVALERSWRWALGLGAITLVGGAAIRFAGIEFAEGSWQSSLRDFLHLFTTWAGVIGLLGFGRRHLNHPSRALPYLNSVAYPFYILHQTVILAIGFCVVRWPLGVFPKFLMIVIASAAMTFALCHLVGAWGPTRALLGMKRAAAIRSWAHLRPPWTRGRDPG